MYFQSFDHEKYKFIQIPELQNNNHPRSNRTSNKTSLSLAGLRIDERGGIYLNPLLDSNSAYFKCYVAEEVHSGDLIGLFSNHFIFQKVKKVVQALNSILSHYRIHFVFQYSRRYPNSK